MLEPCRIAGKAKGGEIQTSHCRAVRRTNSSCKRLASSNIAASSSSERPPVSRTKSAMRDCPAARNDNTTMRPVAHLGGNRRCPQRLDRHSAFPCFNRPSKYGARHRGPSNRSRVAAHRTIAARRRRDRRLFAQCFSGLSHDAADARRGLERAIAFQRADPQIGESHVGRVAQGRRRRLRPSSR